MAEAGRLKLTYADYIHFPDSPRRELIDGEALVAPSPNTRHQDIVLWFGYVITGYLRHHGGGRVFIAPYDVVLSDFDVVQPDIVFVADADADKITELNIRGTPTWVIEVLSDAHRDRTLKRQVYERAGVGEYWIVDPGLRQLEIYRLTGGRYLEPVCVTAPGSASPGGFPQLVIDLSEVPWE